MEIKHIKTEAEYQIAIKRFEILFDSNVDTPEWAEAGVLALLIETYENEHFSVELPDIIEEIRIRMEERKQTKKS